MSLMTGPPKPLVRITTSITRSIVAATRTVSSMTLMLASIVKRAVPTIGPMVIDARCQSDDSNHQIGDLATIWERESHRVLL